MCVYIYIYRERESERLQMVVIIVTIMHCAVLPPHEAADGGHQGRLPQDVDPLPLCMSIIVDFFVCIYDNYISFLVVCSYVLFISV